MNTLKTILIITAITLLTACGGDDSPTPTTKKRITNSEVISSSRTRNYAVAYNGNLIKSYQTIDGGNIVDIVPTYNGDDKIVLLDNVNYSYDDKGRLKKATYSSSSGENETTYIYDSDNRIIRTISKRMENGVEDTTYGNTCTFEYQSGKLKSILRNTNGGSYYKTILEYDANGNIILVTSKSQSSDGISFSKSSNYQITYDTNKNPNYEMLKSAGLLDEAGWSQYYLRGYGNQIFKPIVRVDLGFVHSTLVFYGNKNNVVSSQGRYSSSSYDYTYDDAGYPIKSIGTFSSTYDNGQTHSYSLEINYTYENY